MLIRSLEGGVESLLMGIGAGSYTSPAIVGRDATFNNYIVAHEVKCVANKLSIKFQTGPRRSGFLVSGPDGSMVRVRCYSADRIDRIRGRQHDIILMHALGGGLKEVWEVAKFTLRLDPLSSVMLTSTYEKEIDLEKRRIDDDTYLWHVERSIDRFNNRNN